MKKINCLYIEALTICNISCEYCFFEKGIQERVKGTIDIHSLDQFLEKSAPFFSFNSISLTGGEILLLRDLDDLLPILKKHTNLISLMTNGSLINKEISDLLEKYVDEIHVSLDSISSDYHERIRGKQNQTISGVKILAATKIRKKVIVATISKENSDQVKSLHDFSIENGFELNIHPVDNFSSNIGIKIPKNCSTLMGSMLMDSRGNFFPCFHLRDEENNLGNYKNSFPQSLLENWEKSVRQLSVNLPCYRTRCWPLL